MASDNHTTFQFHSSLQDEEDFENDNDDDDDDQQQQHPHPHNMSRLSVCSSSTMCGVDDAMAMYMSSLSIESFEGDGDADGEFSDVKEVFSDSENELSSCYPLPVKEYGSDNEEGVFMGQKTKEKNPWRCEGTRKETWVWESSEKNRNKSNKKKKEKDDMVKGLSEQSGVRVMTRPKGGRRSLCMDLEEVKACRDLGFELEIPSRLSVSLSNSTLETSSGGTSPIATWRISSPGDDPKDVKARLKMWAQAVAASASASKYGT